MPDLFRRALPVLVVALVGCGGGEGIRSYNVPKTTEPAARAPASEYRILGAVFPADQPVWFFKLPGRADDLAAHEAEFDQLLASVKLQGDIVPTFTLPAGWTLGGPRTVTRMGMSFRYDQTVKFGPPGAPVEMTISRSGGSLLMNVQRWAEQVGRPGITEAALPEHTRPVQGNGVAGIRIDVRGPKDPNAGGAGPFMKGR